MVLKLDASTGKWIEAGEVTCTDAQQPTGDKYPCRACGYTGPIKTDLNSPTALKGLALEVLVQIVETAPRNVSLVAAIRELIDRVEGKAPQSIALTTKDITQRQMPIERLEALEANMSRMLETEQLVIAPS